MKMNFNGEKCVSMAIIASIIYISLVSAFPQTDKRNTRENEQAPNQQNILNALRFLNEEYDSPEAQQMIIEKRYGNGLDFGTGRGNSGAIQALHLIGAAMANGHNNPGKRKRRQAILH